MLPSQCDFTVTILKHDLFRNDDLHTHRCKTRKVKATSHLFSLVITALWIIACQLTPPNPSEQAMKLGKTFIYTLEYNI